MRFCRSSSEGLIAASLLLLLPATDGFVAPQYHNHPQNTAHRRRSKDTTSLHAFWRHWILPSRDDLDFLDHFQETVEGDVAPSSSPQHHHHSSKISEHPKPQSPDNTSLLQLQDAQNAFMSTFVATASLAMALLLAPAASWAVSGGGLYFAGIDISGQDFSKSADYKGKDFTQVIAKNTNFAKSNLQGCRFYKAYLVC